MELPPFSLKHVPTLVNSAYVSTQKSTPRDGSRDDRSKSAESSSGRCARVQEWAAGHRKAGFRQAFAARLDGAQVGRELMEIFRETPEFGRSLTIRLADFLDEQATGDLTLIGGGGEAIVAMRAKKPVLRWYYLSYFLRSASSCSKIPGSSFRAARSFKYLRM